MVWDHYGESDQKRRLGPLRSPVAAGDRHFGCAEVVEIQEPNPKRLSSNASQGNIALADGSVQQFANERLREAVLKTSTTNRLALP